MKKSIIFALVAALALFSSCKEEEDLPLNIIGTWNITGIQTKAANLGGQTVDVYITFDEGNTFDLYQMVGQGRYSHYAGTWSLVETTLTGKYSDGTSWGSSYEISQNDERTTLTMSAAGEDYTYKKSSLPSDLQSKLK